MRTWRQTLLIVFLAGILIVIAALQFVWLKDMRQSEGARIRGELVAGTYLIGNRVDGVLSRYANHFDPSLGRTRILEAWRERDGLPHPELLEKLVILEDGAAERLSDEGFVPTEVPRLEARTGALADPLSLILSNDDWTLVLYLDKAQFFGKLIPELADELLLSRPDASGLEVLISEEASPQNIRYRSREDLIAIEAADVIMPFFRLPREAEEAGEGRFTIRARHGAGSIEEAVDSVFTRNLAMALATLVVLAATLAVLLIQVRRTRALAQRQLDFVATVSHELRTPLAVICSAADNLARGRINDADRITRYGDLIHKEGRRLTDLVGRILNFSAIRSGRARYAFSPQNPAAVMEAAIRENRLLLDENGIEPTRAWEDDLPVLIADGNAVATALGNLIANAVKHGGTEVALSIEPVGESLALTVTDNGPGLSPDERAQLTEPFVRGKRSRERQVQGSGLGLSISEAIARGHGGRLVLGSEPGKGTRAGLILPRQPKGAHR